MAFSLSQRSKVLLAVSVILNLVVLLGFVTGVMLDVLRLAASLVFVMSIGADWRRSGHG